MRFGNSCGMTIKKHTVWSVPVKGGEIDIDPQSRSLFLKGYPDLRDTYARFKEAFANNGELLGACQFPMVALSQNTFEINEEFTVNLAHRFRNGYLINPIGTQISLVSSVDLTGIRLYINGYEAVLDDNMTTRLPEYMSQNITITLTAILGEQFMTQTHVIQNYEWEIILPIHFQSPNHFDMIDTLGIL